MKLIRSLVAAAALCGFCFQVSAQKVQASTQAYGLCAASEEPVFSCTLQGSKPKTVSLCASPASAQGASSFRYLFGGSSKIELDYPSNSNGNEAFTFTRLRYAGATGGYAHTFINDGYKYILYSIEGTGFERSGLLVQRQGQIRAIRELHCKSSTLIESKNAELVRTTSGWKADPDIDAHGLPSTR